MTIYYKGSLVLSKNLGFKKIKFDSGYYKEKKEIEINILNAKYELTAEENDDILNYLIEDEIEIPINIRNIFFEILMSTKLYREKEFDIIYEKITDINGNVYGKEIITGFIFPLFSIDDIWCHTTYSFNYFLDYVKLRGYSNYETKDRDNFSLCKCYCLQNEVADYNEIKKYKFEYTTDYSRLNPKFEFKEIIEKLYNMNVFDDSVITQNNSVQVPNNQNNIPSNPSNSSNSYSNESNSLSKEENVSFSTNSSNNDFIEELEILKKIKEFLPFLPEEDINLLRDMTNNNLDDPSIIKYLKMSRDQKLEFISNKQKLNSDEPEVLDDKPKVSFKKK